LENKTKHVNCGRSKIPLSNSARKRVFCDPRNPFDCFEDSEFYSGMYLFAIDGLF